MPRLRRPTYPRVPELIEILVRKAFVIFRVQPECAFNPFRSTVRIGWRQISWLDYQLLLPSIDHKHLISSLNDHPGRKSERPTNNVIQTKYANQSAVSLPRPCPFTPHATRLCSTLPIEFSRSVVSVVALWLVDSTFNDSFRMCVCWMKGAYSVCMHASSLCVDIRLSRSYTSQL